MTARSSDAEKPLLGLVLSSGAARGAVHAGVLQALEAAAVPIGVVVGTSAGALVGAGWAAGAPADEIAWRVSRATWSDLGSGKPSRRLALLDTSSYRRNLDQLLAGRRIEDFPRRFGAVATDLLTRAPVLLDRGSVTDALCASSAVPGLFAPVSIGGRALVDGALSSPTPTWAARRLGAERVIAVRLKPGPDPLSGAWRSGRAPNCGDDLPADLQILVDTRGYSSWSTRDITTLIELGRRTTESFIEEIGRLAGSEASRRAGLEDPPTAAARPKSGWEPASQLH